ncbi:dihydropteridine reductase [Staphylococcus equorum]|uniref:Dihydropteridine reductase n=1 Tax=Staphylococcus equorum TaxID=246432 RepID=A0A9X4L353_9STAP|nr:hypothetical protein [Staphylococcus equorum]MDG0819635.1 dihydropteridine reductase [Staphylococcus equorum]MDG0840276.1 dihydropteridine reductase [Staphylococcus equorum]MDG0845959.1 dihydropteridine reductase [Staphylococcus equorum]MDK9852286.1 dihydropteridine reductase [Staphylococcus equorum]CCI59694.1 putative uncharacterized protein [Staphylococcus equorum subsp. equorum Mu2]
MQIYWTKINKIINETSEIKTYLLDCPEGFTWEEGSHTHMGLKGFNEGEKPNKSLVRHMSISTVPNENIIGITTRIRKQCSEFKNILNNLEVGQEVAIFKTHSNIPLKRESKNVYLLSSGVGLATYRPIVLKYLENAKDVNKIHSINVDSSREFLFTDIFKSVPDKKFTSQFVDSRTSYYEELENIAMDKNALFYIVGSDEFVTQNIEKLLELDVKTSQIVIDKREKQRSEFLTI